MADDFNSTSVSGTTSGAVANTLLFSEPFLTLQHQGVAFRVLDAAANLYRYFIITQAWDSQLAYGVWAGPSPPAFSSTVFWEETAAGGHRGGFRTVGLFQQRLVFGGTRDAGTSIWMSKAGRYRNFDLGSGADGDAIAVTSSGGVRNIQHLFPGLGALLIFTDKGILASPAGDNSGLLTPGTARFEPYLEDVASSAVVPMAFDGGILFTHSLSGAVRDAARGSGGAIAVTPLSQAVASVLGRAIAADVSQANSLRPEQYAFFVNSAGEMAVLHSSRESEVSAWVRWTTNGFYRGIVTVLGKVFTAVTRGGTLRLEVFDASYSLDSAKRGVPPLVHLGLSGFLADVLSPRAYYGRFLINGAGGMDAVPEDDPEIEVGLGFDWEIVPLPPILDAPGQTLTNMTQRVVQTELLLEGALSARVQEDRMILRTGVFDVAGLPTRSGWWTAKHLGWSRRDEPMLAELKITRDIPAACGVLSMIRKVVT